MKSIDIKSLLIGILGTALVMVLMGVENTAKLKEHTSLNLEKQEIYPLNKTLDTLAKQKQAGKLSESILDKLVDPAFTVQSSFFLLERLPKRAKSNRLEKEGNVVWHVATCDQSFDRETDYEGKCKDFYFSWDQEVYSGGTVNVEVEVYMTCLDDSCHHELLLEFAQCPRPVWHPRRQHAWTQKVAWLHKTTNMVHCQGKEENEGASEQRLEMSMNLFKRRRCMLMAGRWV